MTTREAIIELTDDNFAAEVEEMDALTLVDFWAEWCGPCRLVAPVVRELHAEYGRRGLTVGSMDVDANPRVQVKYGVRSIPTILFFKGGEVVDRVVGFVPRPRLEEKILRHL